MPARFWWSSLTSNMFTRFTTRRLAVVKPATGNSDVTEYFLKSNVRLRFSWILEVRINA